MASACENTRGESGLSPDAGGGLRLGSCLLFALTRMPARVLDSRPRLDASETMPAGSEPPGSIPVEPEWPQAAPDFVEVVEPRPVFVIKPGVVCSCRRSPSK